MMIAEGDIVVTEHEEEWVFHTGERILHPFASVMVFAPTRKNRTLVGLFESRQSARKCARLVARTHCSRYRSAKK